MRRALAIAGVGLAVLLAGAAAAPTATPGEAATGYGLQAAATPSPGGSPAPGPPQPFLEPEARSLKPASPTAPSTPPASEAHAARYPPLGRRVRVEPGDTWQSLASRHLGEPAAAPELAALNGGGDRPKAGTEIAVPGEERALALAAAAAAGAAAERARTAGVAAEALADATRALERSTAARGRATYAAAQRLAQEATDLADAARERLELAQGKRTRFSVEARGDRASVAAQGGGAVEVAGSGAPVALRPGEGATVTDGKASARAMLPAPAPLAPAAGDTLLLPAPGRTETRAATLKWSAVPGAKGYVLEVLSGGRRKLRSRIAATEAAVPLASLGEGRFRWTVSAEDAAGDAGTPSAESWFRVETEPPPPTRLEVGKGQWQP